jgi:hypothetical protein
MIRIVGLIKGRLRNAGRGAVAVALISSALLGVGVLGGKANPIVIPIPVLMFEADATLAPTKLPRSGREPIAFHLESKVSAQEEHPPALREALLALDKHTTIDAQNFAACPRGLAEHDGQARTLRLCGDAIVGRGDVGVEILDPQSGALRDASTRLTIFKGGARGGTTTLLFRLEPLAPSRSPLLAVAKSRPLERGRFGTQMTIVFPPIAEGNGSIVSLGFGLRRRAPGEHLAGIMRASCPDGHLAFHLTGVFADGTKLVGAWFRTCTTAP